MSKQRKNSDINILNYFIIDIQTPKNNSKTMDNSNNTHTKLIELNDILVYPRKKEQKSNNVLFGIMIFLEIRDIVCFKLTCKTISYSIDDKFITNYIKHVDLTPKIREHYWMEYLNISRYILYIKLVLKKSIVRYLIKTTYTNTLSHKSIK